MFLHPKDLLHLAWTSKELNRLFTSRQTLNVWKATLADVPDLPPCPEDLTLLEYVRLMFEDICTVSEILTFRYRH